MKEQPMNADPVALSRQRSATMPLIASAEDGPPRAQPSFGSGVLAAALAIGFLHHIDHILRVDHSGWPFRPDVTPFTWSLAVYPLLVSALVLRHRPWLRVALVGAVLAAVQTAHIVVETPEQQFQTWASGVSSEPYALGVPNLLGIASPIGGALSVGISLALSALLVTALVAYVIEARRRSV
jgi:hypothetical protein